LCAKTNVLARRTAPAKMARLKIERIKIRGVQILIVMVGYLPYRHDRELD